MEELVFLIQLCLFPGVFTIQLLYYYIQMTAIYQMPEK